MLLFDLLSVLRTDVPSVLVGDPRISPTFVGGPDDSVHWGTTSKAACCGGFCCAWRICYTILMVLSDRQGTYYVFYVTCQLVAIKWPELCTYCSKIEWGRLFPTIHFIANEKACSAELKALFTFKTHHKFVYTTVWFNLRLFDPIIPLVQYAKDVSRTQCSHNLNCLAYGESWCRQDCWMYWSVFHCQ